MNGAAVRVKNVSAIWVAYCSATAVRFLRQQLSGLRPIIQIHRLHSIRPIQPGYLVPADQQAGLVDGGEGLVVHGHIDDLTPLELPCTGRLFFVDPKSVLPAANAQDGDALPLYREAGQRFNQRHHGGVIGPDAAVQQDVPVLDHRLQISGSRGSRRGHFRHRLVAVQEVPRMVRSLVHGGVAMFGLGGRYQQSVPGFPQGFVSQGLPKQFIKSGPVVSVASQSSQQPTALRPLLRWEHAMPLVDVQVQQRTSGQSGAQSQSNNSTS